VGQRGSELEQRIDHIAMLRPPGAHLSLVRGHGSISRPPRTVLRGCRFCKVGLHLETIGMVWSMLSSLTRQSFSLQFLRFLGVALPQELR